MQREEDQSDKEPVTVNRAAEVVSVIDVLQELGGQSEEKQEKI